MPLLRSVVSAVLPLALLTCAASAPTAWAGRSASPLTAARGDWRQFHFDAAHTGFNPHEDVLGVSNVGDLTLDWQASTVGTVLSSPAVAGGKVYVSTYASRARLYAFNAASGRAVWKALIPGTFSSPAVAEGLVYVGTNLFPSQVLAFDANTGAPAWSADFNSGVGDITFAGGILYFGAEGTLWALDAGTGEEVWHSPPVDPTNSPAVSNGTVYVGARADSRVYAFDALTGAIDWSVPTETTVDSPLTVANGAVYANYGSSLRALDAESGATLWTADTGIGSEDTAPAVAEGVVYVLTGEARLWAFDAATGAHIWDKRAGAGTQVESSPAVANGVLYMSNQNIRAVRAASGVELWEADIFNVHSSPAVSDGSLYIGADRSVAAFRLPAPP
jgi:outer membrane protein assembly factor BamB